MKYRGTVSQGVVVFRGAERPGDGTEVEVRAVDPAAVAAALSERGGGGGGGGLTT